MGGRVFNCMLVERGGEGEGEGGFTWMDIMVSPIDVCTTEGFDHPWIYLVVLYVRITRALGAVQ